MIIRATQKTLKLAGLKVRKDSPDELNEMPGEWTAGVVSLGKPGKMAIHYVHNVTRISLLINGKSINKANDQLAVKLSDYLKRFDFLDLEKLFEMDTPIELFGSACRSVLGHMNELRRDFEYQFERFATVETMDFNKVEDLYFDSPFRVKRLGSGLIKTQDILENLKKSFVK